MYLLMTYTMAVVAPPYRVVFLNATGSSKNDPYFLLYYASLLYYRVKLV